MKRIVFMGILGLALASVLHAEETEIFRFREPIVVETNENVSSAVAIGSSVRVLGSVRQNVVALGGDVWVGPQAVVQGDAVAIGGRVLRAPGGLIGGKITSFPFSLDRIHKAIALAIPMLMVGMGALVGAAIVAGSIGSIAIAVLVLVLFPAQTAKAREAVENRPIQSLFAGFAALMMFFPVIIFLVITVIGIPLSFAVAALAMAALILGTVAVGQTVGMRLAAAVKKPLPPVAAGLVGLGLLTLAAAVPFIGVLIQGLIVCLALGAVIFSRFKAA